MKTQISKNIFLSLLLSLSLSTAHAQGLKGFLKSLQTKITEVTKESSIKETLTVDNSQLSLTGTVNFDVKWIMISITKNDFVEQLVLPIENGSYDTRLSLQNGAGVYDITLYTNSNIERSANYTYVKKFSVENTDLIDRSFLLPTPKVQSEDEVIKVLVKGLTENAENEEEAFLAIYDYVTATIKYDYEALNDRSLRMDYNAVNTLTYSKALCEGYANLIAAMARAYGIRTKVITGMAKTSSGGGSHAWNEVFINGEWKLVDATWDAILSARTYLFMDTETFSINHIKEKETLY